MLESSDDYKEDNSHTHLLLWWVADLKSMLLVTGGTDFIGRAVLKKLADYDYPVRLLLQPSQASPKLPPGVRVDVALASLNDARGVRASLVGVEKVIHLAGNHLENSSGDLGLADVQGTRILSEAAADAGVKHILYLSLLGAERSSAFPLLRSRAYAEQAIHEFGVPATIIRTGLLYGEDDQFTTSLAILLAMSVFFFPMPGDGSITTQPLWVDDLATCITWALDDPDAVGQVYDIGGPEYLTFKQIVQMVIQETGTQRILISARPPYLRAGAWVMERMLRYSPVTTRWLDYFAVSRTTDLNNLPQAFGLSPSRMEEKLGYLRGQNWGWELLQKQFQSN